jgi:hypothetical protein
MTRTALLNNVDHHGLKVVTGHSQAYGDSVNQTVVFPTEFAEIQREYPILFRRNEAGEFYAIALLGLDKGENLFLTERGWQARYVPAIHQRGPFIIGFQNKESGGEMHREPVIHVDLDDPRVNDTDGQPLFLQHGGNSPYLQHVSHVLKVINRGTEIARPMFGAFQDAGLVEPAMLEIRLDEHTVYKVPEVYSINEETLAGLSGATLERLHSAGYLRAAYLALASLANVSRLIELKNAKRASNP